MNKPHKINEFIGQEKVVECLRLLIDSRKKTGKELGHVLISGPSGVGKSTLAEILANEGGFNYALFMGPSLSTKTDLAKLVDVIRSSKNLLLFIDEVHRITRRVEERLYPIIQDFIVPSDDGVNEVLPRFTLVGATISPGMLKRPFRDRFIHQYSLNYYSNEEMSRIIRYLDPRLDDNQANQIALRSQGVPRIARRLLTELEVTLSAAGKSSPKISDIEQTFVRLELDRFGFCRIERDILRYLNRCNKPVGEKTLKSVFELHEDDLTFIHERALQLHGMIRKTARGREITSDGKKFLMELV